MSTLSIGQVAGRAGIATSAIRYYESEGLIPKAARRNGRRIYGEEVLERLALINLVKGAGFTVAETRALLKGFARKTPPGERWRELAARKIVQLDDRIAEAERMKAVLTQVSRCECPTFDDCAEALAKHGGCP